MWCGNSYMLSSKVVKSIYKGFNASGLCLSILSSLSSLNIGAAEGVGVILSGRLMGNLMIRSVLTSNGLCVRRVWKEKNNVFFTNPRWGLVPVPERGPVT